MTLAVDHYKVGNPVVMGCRRLEEDGPYREALRHVFRDAVDDYTVISAMA